MNILSVWFTFDSPRLKLLDKLLGYEIIIGSRYVVVIMGLASLLVAQTLYRQKRVAWFLSLFILGVSGVAHVLKGADIEEAGLCLILLGVLLPLYRYCKVKSDPIRVIKSGKILLGLVIFVALYTILGIYIFSDNLGIDFSKNSLWSIIFNVLLFDASNINPVGKEANFYINSLFIINSIAYITGLIYALSPVIARNLPGTDYEKYKKITSKNASQPVQFFTLSKDYQHFYYHNDDREGLINYKVSNRVALAIGNPCIDGNLSEITAQWLENIYEYDWIPAVYQAQGEIVEIMKQYGYNNLPIGVEAVIKLETFSLAGKKMQNLRSGRNKGVKEGWEVREYKSSDWDLIKNLDSKWLTIHGAKENAFAMGKSSPDYLESTRTVMLFDKDNNLLAYLNNIDLPLSETRSVDLMRRDTDSPPGTMEFLFLNEILQAKEEGFSYYDLGFSPLAKVDEGFSDNKTVVKLFKLIYEKQKRYYDFHGLHNFKSKFKPEWNQSYLVYPNIIELPKVLMALLNFNKKI